MRPLVKLEIQLEDDCNFMNNLKLKVAYALCDEFQSAQSIKVSTTIFKYFLCTYIKSYVLTLGLN